VRRLSSSETFAYDAATNLSARTGPAATYAIDGANRFTSDGARAFTWDGADRLIQRGTDAFAHDDPLARMTSSTVTGPLGTVTRTYGYDGDGLLRSRSAAALTTSFLWDPSVAPAPLLQAGNDRVVHGQGRLYLVRADGSTLTLVRDALGSVRAEVNDAGTITKAFRYAAYGEIAQATPLGAVPTLLGFAGELRDPSGLTYLRARWYDTGTGRFMTADPYPGMVNYPASLNAFGYVVGRATFLTDPLGLDPNSEPDDPGLGCQKFFLCNTRAVFAWEADVMVLIPVRTPVGYSLISFAKGIKGVGAGRPAHPVLRPGHRYHRRSRGSGPRPHSTRSRTRSTTTSRSTARRSAPVQSRTTP
jgi:RHS repeat-associated protein